MSDLLTQTFFNSPSEKLNPSGDTSSGFYHFNIRESWKHTTKAPADTATEKYQIRWQIDSTERTDVAPKDDTSEFEVKSVLAIDPTASQNSPYQQIFIKGTRGFNINGKNLIKHKYTIQIDFSAIIYKWDLTLPQEDRKWVEYENPAESDYSMGGPLGTVNKWTDYIYIDHGANIVPRRKHLRIKEVSNTSPFDFVEGGEEGVVSDELNLYPVGDYLKTLDSLATTVDEIKYYKITVVGHLKNESTWAADVSLKYQPWDPSDTDVTVATGSETEVPATVAETLSEEDAGSLDEGEVTLLEDVPELTPWDDEDPDTPRESGLEKGTKIVRNGRVETRTIVVRQPVEYENVYRTTNDLKPEIIASIDGGSGKITPGQGHVLNSTMYPNTIEWISKKKLNWPSSSLLGYSKPSPGALQFWVGFQTSKTNPAQVLRLRDATISAPHTLGNGETTAENLKDFPKKLAQYYNIDNFNGEQSMDGVTAFPHLTNLFTDLGDQTTATPLRIRLQEYNEELKLHNDMADPEKGGMFVFMNPWIAEGHPGAGYDAYIRENGSWSQKLENALWGASKSLIDYSFSLMNDANMKPGIKAKLALIMSQINSPDGLKKHFNTDDLNEHMPSGAKYRDKTTGESYSLFSATIKPIPVSRPICIKEIKYMGAGSHLETLMQAWGNVGGKLTPAAHWIATNMCLSRTTWVIYDLETADFYGFLTDDKWQLHQPAAAEFISGLNSYTPDKRVKMKYFNKVSKRDLGHEWTWGINAAGLKFCRPHIQFGKDGDSYAVINRIAPEIRMDGKLHKFSFGGGIGTGDAKGRLGNQYTKTENYVVARDYAHHLGFTAELMFGPENQEVTDIKGAVEYTITGLPGGGTRKIIPNIQVTTGVGYDKKYFSPLTKDYTDQWSAHVTVETPLLYCKAAYMKDSEKSDLIGIGVTARAKWGQFFFGYARHRGRGGNDTFSTLKEFPEYSFMPNLSNLLSNQHDPNIGPNEVRMNKSGEIMFGFTVEEGLSADDEASISAFLKYIIPVGGGGG